MTEIQLYDPAETAARGRLIRDVRAALDKLAAHGTRTQVADALAAAGHLGHPREARWCPVAKFVAAAVPDAEFVAVTRLLVAFDLDGETTVGLPDAVAAFVRRFDEEGYPALISPEDPPARSDPPPPAAASSTADPDADPA